MFSKKKRSSLPINRKFHTFRFEILVSSKKKRSSPQSIAGFCNFCPDFVVIPEKNKKFFRLGSASYFSNFIPNQYHFSLNKKIYTSSRKSLSCNPEKFGHATHDLHALTARHWCKSMKDFRLFCSVINKFLLCKIDPEEMNVKLLYNKQKSFFFL